MSQLLSFRVATVLLPLVLVATGCGKSSKNPASSLGAVAGYETSPAAPIAAPLAPTAPGAPTAAALMAQVQQAWTNTHTVTAHYEFWEKSGSTTEDDTVDMWFEKPGHYRLEVGTATEALKRGSKSVFNTANRQITSQPGGALSFVKLSGTLDDDRSKSVRGYTLDETDYATTVNMVLAGTARVQLLEARPTGAVLSLPNPTRYPGVETMQFTLDPTKYLPTDFQLISHGQVVHTCKYTRLTVNPAISSDKFSL